MRVVEISVIILKTNRAKVVWGHYCIMAIKIPLFIKKLPRLFVVIRLNLRRKRERIHACIIIFTLINIVNHNCARDTKLEYLILQS